MRWRVKLKLTYQSPAQIRVLVLVLCLAMIATSVLLWTQVEAAEPTPQPPVRFPSQFYLTSIPPYYTGAEALTACAPGYHMASLWEMVDVTGLRYNQSLGDTNADMGQGPISSASGWVRTGTDADQSGTAGISNCNGWTSESAHHTGSYAFLPGVWDGGGADIGVWNVATGSCSANLRVWCMADVPGYPIYMPIVMHQ